jgi:hypothetical protein
MEHELALALTFEAHETGLDLADVIRAALRAYLAPRIEKERQVRARLSRTTEAIFERLRQRREPVQDRREAPRD